MFLFFFTLFCTCNILLLMKINWHIELKWFLRILSILHYVSFFYFSKNLVFMQNDFLLQQFIYYYSVHQIQADTWLQLHYLYIFYEKWTLKHMKSVKSDWNLNTESTEWMGDMLWIHCEGWWSGIIYDVYLIH